jgi:DNA-directed RNA polymerase specialized sigma24 family protein
MVDCSEVVTYGSLALDGSLPVEASQAIGEHLRACAGCTHHVDQIAKTRALLGARVGARRGPKATPRHGQGDEDDESGRSPRELAHRHSYLVTLARATDPAHADDLVQDTWDHFFSADPGNVPDRAELAAYLVRHAHEHARGDEADGEAWADDLAQHHPHNPADLAETDLPADPGGYDDWRTLADLDALDADADAAELYFPDLYGDGPNKGEWRVPPTAWPSVTRMLSPDEEADTAELYSKVDAALDELPDTLADALYLVDIEGHALTTAGSLLGRGVVDLQRDLVRARDHVRGSIDRYLDSR